MTRPTSADENSIKPTDLRGILKYVPMFRDHVFVIAFDGSLVANEIFPNVLLDVAVLRSLNIKVVLVHGIGQQLRELAAQRQIEITDAHGEGPTDQATLDLATELSSSISLQIIQEMTRNQLRCATTNAIRSKPTGIVKGKDQLLSGVVDKIDISMLNQMLDSQTVPVVTPIAFNREGNTLRLNSDLLAAELAAQLEASKLIYLTTQDSLPQTNLPLADLVTILEDAPADIPERLRSKAQYTISAIRAGVPRAHILDGRIFGALLNEIFDKVGVGTMVYTNDYESIRTAVSADAYAIYNITRNGVRSATLIQRSLENIEQEITNFLVYEIDGSIVGCLHLQPHENGQTIEIGSVYVQSFYQNKGVGRRLIESACSQASDRGAQRLIALSTQATSFFTRICGFQEGTIEDLPAERRTSYQSSGRNSNILIKPVD